MKIGDFHSSEDTNCSPLHCNCPEDLRYHLGSIHTHTHRVCMIDNRMWNKSYNYKKYRTSTIKNTVNTYFKMSNVRINPL